MSGRVFSPHNLNQWGKPPCQTLLPQLHKPVKTDCIICAGAFSKRSKKVKKSGLIDLNEGFLASVISRVLCWQNFLMCIFNEIRMNCKQEVHFPSQNLMMIFILYEFFMEFFGKAVQAYLKRKFSIYSFQMQAQLSKNLCWWWLWDTTLLLLIASVHLIQVVSNSLCPLNQGS